MRPDGSGVQRLTTLPADSAAASPAWSPDARRLAFGVFPPDAPAEIWVMNADGSGLRRLLADPAADDLTPSFAPDGRHVVFVRCTERGCAIHRVRTDGARLQSITPFQPGITDWAPTYSPDGARLAFGSFGRGGVDAATYVMHADGRHIRRVTPPDLQILGGDWSPDGSRLTAGSNCCNPHNGDIWTFKPNGKRPTQLMDTPDENDVGSTWSPDGRAIAFERVNPEFTDSNVYAMRADGRGVRLVQAHARYPSWSPR
jgi:TolB protein